MGYNLFPTNPFDGQTWELLEGDNPGIYRWSETLREWVPQFAPGQITPDQDEPGTKSLKVVAIREEKYEELGEDGRDPWTLYIQSERVPPEGG